MYGGRVDYCSRTSKWLREQYCEDGIVSGKWYFCENGCSDGKCL